MFTPTTSHSGPQGRESTLPPASSYHTFQWFQPDRLELETTVPHPPSVPGQQDPHHNPQEPFKQAKAPTQNTHSQLEVAKRRHDTEVGAKRRQDAREKRNRQNLESEEIKKRSESRRLSHRFEAAPPGSPQ